MQQTKKEEVLLINNSLNEYLNVSYNRQILNDPRVLDLVKILEMNIESLEELFINIENEQKNLPLSQSKIQERINKKVITELKKLNNKKDPKYKVKMEALARISYRIPERYRFI